MTGSRGKVPGPTQDEVAKGVAKRRNSVGALGRAAHETCTTGCSATERWIGGGARLVPAEAGVAYVCAAPMRIHCDGFREAKALSGQYPVRTVDALITWIGGMLARSLPARCSNFAKARRLSTLSGATL